MNDYNTNHSWKLLNNKYWQIHSDQYEQPYITDAYENNNGSCPPGMVEINGLMKQDPDVRLFSGNNIDALQKLSCKTWLNKEPIWKDRCKEYDRSKWINMSSSYSVRPMRYCIDRFESGVRKGEYPIVMINYDEADNVCKVRSDRLCSELEWTFACEGEEAMPYPYGYIRDENKCVIDKVWRQYSNNLFPRNTVSSMKELDKLWQGEAAGSRKYCRSPFGVYDMTGNVDEITSASYKDSKYKMVLKGGYWGGNVRNRCRAATRSHDESFAFYQASFRCCRDL